MSSIHEILDRNPNWHELIKAEYGYLKVAENGYMRFVSASECDWDILFRYPFNNEILGVIDSMEIGQEVVVVLEGDAPPDAPPDEDLNTYWLYYEVIKLPIPIPVDED
jgi:hypothetical protein